MLASDEARAVEGNAICDDEVVCGNVGEVMNVCCGDGAGENIAGETSSCSCGPNSKSSSLSYSPRLSALRKADILFIRVACKSRTVGKVVVHVLMDNVEIELHCNKETIQLLVAMETFCINKRVNLFEQKIPIWFGT